LTLIFIAFNHSFSLLAQKKKNQKEKAVDHLFRFQRNTLRCSLKADASESRFAPPSRVPGFFCAARLRDMAPKIATKYF
jgi:hypothetical protein